MTECEKYRGEILEAVSVRGPMTAEAREHLDSCESCRSLFVATEWIARGVRSAPKDAPSPETARRILVAAREELEKKRSSVPRVRRWQAAGVIAASVILFVTGMWLLGTGKEPMDAAAVAVLEEKVDGELDRMRTGMDGLWPEGGWGTRESGGVSYRIDSFQVRLEQFRARSRSETFPLEFTPEKEARQQEGRGHLHQAIGRHIS